MLEAAPVEDDVLDVLNSDVVLPKPRAALGEERPEHRHALDPIRARSRASRACRRTTRPAASASAAIKPSK